MRAGGAPVAALLLISASLVIQVTSEDLYWEGEEDASNEFLEVKEHGSGIYGRLSRMKREFSIWNIFSDTTASSTTPEPETVEDTTSDTAGGPLPFDDEAGDGSGAHVPGDPEPKEKTLRVTFVAMQPYQEDYSNRDSLQFQNFSKSLANAVNKIYEEQARNREISGTQRASLVRIQSRTSDDFSCKVTLDIVTIGYYDMEKIAEILRKHIQGRRSLEGVVVSDLDFSANVIDPASAGSCPDDWLRCDAHIYGDAGACLPLSVRCNGELECADGTDEAGCPPETVNKIPDAEEDPSLFGTERSNPAESQDTEESSVNRECHPDELQCDYTRCVSLSKTCDGHSDCDDNSDELNCTPIGETCADGDFRCNDGKCIPRARQCDDVVDCRDKEDELGCDCKNGDFQCRDSNVCIEERKLCDGVKHCSDGSDEVDCLEVAWSGHHVCHERGKFRCRDGTCISILLRCDGYRDCTPDGSDEIDCPCAPEQWQCDYGSCIKLSQRCDGRVDCPADRSDERNCLALPPLTPPAYFTCKDGSYILESQRCNRHYDCPSGDYSDEVNCPCGDGDFKCDNGYCIPESKHCDRTHDCQDRSDERDCKYGTICMASEYKCSSGECVHAAAQCNGTKECPDGSDERNCPGCKRDQFQCRDGTCLNVALRCNMQRNCPGGEDELNCEPCEHECDGICLDASQICDGERDCPDGSDEYACECDGPDNFRCANGECLKKTLRCNGLPDCGDQSDEKGCDKIMISPQDCADNQFLCANGQCINMDFYCDDHPDCTDGSDEEDCRCKEGERLCRSGQCISEDLFCNGYPDCSDNSDELNCATTAPPFWTTTTTWKPFTTTFRPPSQYPPQTEYTQRPDLSTRRPNLSGACDRNQFRCENGPCIDAYRRCDGHRDCPRDDSDELDCPPNSPVPFYLTTFPEAQDIRDGGDVVFQCRDESLNRAPVRWAREGGRPLKQGSTDINGRLEMSRVTTADSGVYICRAYEHEGAPGSEVRVILTVEIPATTFRPPVFNCQASEATCANGQCIPKTSVCDGKFDCMDQSDEETCNNHHGLCEPNQYRCENRRCVLKSWICDGEDDCGDASDERECAVARPGEACSQAEFTCNDRQCIPKSFHCDNHPDCSGGEDERCVNITIKRQPTPAHVQLNSGELLRLECEAVGIPVPYINWRLNWGHVPNKCSSTNDNGLGVLTCPDMQPDDSGAYSCEAVNNRATAFGALDSIVTVNRGLSVCPSGYFNSEARSPSECIRCFCFGESTQCKSADLFIFNIPPPLGEDGTRLVGVQLEPNGNARVSSTPVTNQYYFQPLRNGATVTKLQVQGYPSSTDSFPYLTLPESYNGKKLTSYGGYIRYTVTPQSPRPNTGYDSRMPDVIVQGKYRTLLYNRDRSDPRNTNVEVRLTEGPWQRATPSGLETASRQDIMMALDDIQLILLRASVNGAGVNITGFSMESANSTNMGLGPANLVEECSCPPGYEGLSCEKCTSGYVRESSGAWLGNCVREVPRPCPAGTYGDPSTGASCRACPCPLTDLNNQFARTCSLGPRGNIICDCNPGYEGDRCEYCAQGYVGNPLAPGDSCRREVTSSCDAVGTLRSRLPDQCDCKQNVEGKYCDQCKTGSFHLSEDNRHGCAKCFCSGLTNQCTSSDLRRNTTTVTYNTPQIVEQLNVYQSAPFGAGGRYNTPVETAAKPQLVRNELLLNEVDRSRNTIYYWSLPRSFTLDKVTSYGGYLRYTLRDVPVSGGSNTDPDVQLIGDNQLNLLHFGNFNPSSNGVLEATVQFHERSWRRADGKTISRQHFLLAIADVRAILVKATYSSNYQIATLVSSSIDMADGNGDGPVAAEVELCECPQGYVGTSCEDCAPGFTRSEKALYFKRCVPCNCNGSMCDPDTGLCFECPNYTTGPNCEDCIPGYVRNLYNNICMPEVDESYSPDDNCNCDSRGTLEEEPRCDGAGRCRCKPSVTGESCNRCSPGSFGLSLDNPDGCIQCYCSGVTNDCYEDTNLYWGQIPVPMVGVLNYNNYSITDLHAQKVINDHFIPNMDDSKLTYSFSFSPDEELFWSLPISTLPGNMLLSYGGNLTFKQKFQVANSLPVYNNPGTDVVLVGDEYSVYWTNPRSFQSGEELVPLVERNWFVLNSRTSASRGVFMSVLSNLKRVLVRATLADLEREKLDFTSIAVVSMDKAGEERGTIATKGIESCRCPAGYIGRSCESCAAGYYKLNGRCQPCSCNGHDCYVDSYDRVVCVCPDPDSGSDCSPLGEPQLTTVRPLPPQSTVTVTISSPTIKIQNVGSSVSYTCQARSRNRPGALPVRWSKKDGYLPQGRHQIDDETGTLRIESVQVEDSGTYVCQTNDGVTTGQATATLTVGSNPMERPTAIIYPAVQEYYEGERVQLECRTTGNPTPTITWQRGDGQPIPLAVILDGPLLIIERATVEDSGDYRCIAYNNADTTDSVASVTVRPQPSRPYGGRLSVKPSLPQVVEGRDTKVICTGTANIPPGSIKWVRQDGIELASNAQSLDGVLEINVARLENQGVYTCKTSSGEANSMAVLVTVVPLGTPSPDDFPDVEVDVERLSIPTGESRIIHCTPRGNPLPRIVWTKHEGELGRGTSQRGNSLTISNADENDRGLYVCTGFLEGNPVAMKYVTVDIETRIRPRVQIWPPEDVRARIGSQFELRCQVLEGDPHPDIIWSRSKGRELSYDAAVGPAEVIRFSKIDVNDEGEYICTATNKAGIDTVTATLRVWSPPEITITPQRINSMNLGENLDIKCRANGYPEPLVSIYRREGPGRGREIVPPTPGAAVLRLQAASEADDGDYLCTATTPDQTVDEQITIQVERGDIGLGNEEVGSGFEDPYNPDQQPAPSDIWAAEGQDGTLGCNYTSDYDHDLRWSRRDRRPLQRNAEQINNELIIHSATKADSGEYECTLIDRRTGYEMHSAYVSLVVITPARVTLRPASQTVSPGQSPTVECIVDGDDIFDVSWEPTQNDISSRVENRGRTLIFHRIEVEDAGGYNCTARNRVSVASGIAQVIVNEPDRVASESHDNEQVARVGQTVRFRCNTQPQAAPAQRFRVDWTKNGRPLPSSARVFSDGSVQIKLAKLSDSGHYVCTTRDEYGRITDTNYINLQIEGIIECVKTKFRCNDGSGCVDNALLCDGRYDCEDHSDEECLTDSQMTNTLSDYPPYTGSRVEEQALASIRQPNRQYQVGDNVNVPCVATAAEVRVEWERLNTREHVYQQVFGGGSTLIINSVAESDAGIYRCTGTKNYPFEHSTYEDFNLEVQAPVDPPYPSNQEKIVAARVGQSVYLPCPDLEQAASVEWRREYSPFAPNIRANEPNLRLNQVTGADAGTYICRVNNGRTITEARVVLVVNGVVPQFDRYSWLELPNLADVFTQFDIEISFKPMDNDGLILFDDGKGGSFIALRLYNGIPEMVLDVSSVPITVSAKRPLQLDTWHTVRLSRMNTKMSMNVDDAGPFTATIPTQLAVMELSNPLYIGGVPQSVQLPGVLEGTPGFTGCVGMLILGKQEQDIMTDSRKERVRECDSCSPNQCLNDGVCQEARNERGYLCLCPAGYAGQNCDHTGEGCRPHICGPGKCTEVGDTYKCSCPITHTGHNCERQQSIEYPAFTGSGFLAIPAPESSRTLSMSLKIKAMSPVTDGIIMYCAESEQGLGGFTSLTVRAQRLELRYQTGDAATPDVLASQRELRPNEWTKVTITRTGPRVRLSINDNSDATIYLSQPNKSGELHLKTPMYVGGVDDSTILNNNIGVSGGFSGCIKDVQVSGKNNATLNIVNASIYSANVQECSSYDRGDIPDEPENSEDQGVCSRCRNGARCSLDGSSCLCPTGYSGIYCQNRDASYPSSPCSANPCRHGTCRPATSRQNRFNYTCDCPFGYSGQNCHIALPFTTSVAFEGNGYIELAADNLRYDNYSVELGVAVITTSSDGVLLYQKESNAGNRGDYILLRLENARAVLELDLGDGPVILREDTIDVSDGVSHVIAVTIYKNKQIELRVEGRSQTQIYEGLTSVMSADSNIYIGGIPNTLNKWHYPGMKGCIEAIELTKEYPKGHTVVLSQAVVGGINAHRCKDSIFPDVYPYFEEIDVFESPPPRFYFNAKLGLSPNLFLHMTIIPSFLYHL